MTIENMNKDKEENGECDHMLGNGENTDTNTEKNNDNLEGLPVDRGWAWAVLAGVALYLFFFGAVRKNFGLFFVAFQERYSTNASVTSLVATIQNIIISVSSLLIMTIGMHYMSNRTSILIGGVVKTVATIVAALSTDVRVLFFSIGILDGIGISLAQNPVISMLGEYFLKKRGMANGLAFCAASCGALMFAPIITALFENHGYIGTMLIAAGMSFNCCFTGMILRPISSFDRSKKQPKPDASSKTNYSPRPDTAMNEKLTDKNMLKQISFHLREGERDPPFRSLEFIPVKDSELREQQNSLLRVNSSNQINDSITTRRRVRTFSENAHFENLNHLIHSLSDSKFAIYGSTQGVGSSVINVHDNLERALSQTVDTEISTEQTCCLTCKRKTIQVLKIIFDVSLFKNEVFPCILVLAFMMVSGGDCLLIMLPPHFKDLGLTNDQRGILLLLFSCCDLFSRIILTIIADRPFIKRNTILGFAGAVLGLACHFLRFFKSFGSMIAFCIITGPFCHLYWAIHAVILVDYLSLAKLKSSLGFMTLCHGFSISVVLPIAGAIRDNTGTYISTYHLLGTILLMGSAMAFILPYVDKRAKERHNSSVTV